MKTFFLSGIIILTSLIAGCDRPPCENKNLVFEKYPIDSREYHEELLKTLDKAGKEALSYWMNQYVSENGREYIIVHIQGKGICAKGKIRVKYWDGIEGIRRTKGISYIGAELIGLNFEANEDSAQPEFLYKGISFILD